MAFTVRPARVDDGEEMLALMPRLAAFDLPESRNPEHLWMHDAELLRQWLGGETSDCLVHVAEDEGGGVVALAIATLRPEMLSHEPSSHLEAIAVAEGSERQGIGSALLTAIEAEAASRGARSMTLHVFASNGRARAAYEKSGYEGELMRYTKPLHD